MNAMNENNQEQRKAELNIRRLERKLINRVKEVCIKEGFHKVRLQLEYLENNQTPLPYPDLTLGQTVSAWQTGINKAKEKLVLDKEWGAT